MFFFIIVMKLLKLFFVFSFCLDFLFIVNKRILKYLGKFIDFFYFGRCSVWFCVLVLEIINNDVKFIVIKEGCLLNFFFSCFFFDIMEFVYNEFYGFFFLSFKVYMII